MAEAELSLEKLVEMRDALVEGIIKGSQIKQWGRQDLTHVRQNLSELRESLAWVERQIRIRTHGKPTVRGAVAL